MSNVRMLTITLKPGTSSWTMRIKSRNALCDASARRESSESITRNFRSLGWARSAAKKSSTPMLFNKLAKRSNCVVLGPQKDYAIAYFSPACNK